MFFCRGGDGEVMLHYVTIFLLLSLVVCAGCGEDTELPEEPEEPVDKIENGAVYGTVTDDETDDPLQGASVNIGGEVVLSDASGKYVLQGIPFADRIEVSVTADDYREYKTSISLDQEISFLDVSLVPVDSPTIRILEMLETLSAGIESLDNDALLSIQACFSEDYVAASDPINDQATIFGVVAGVVPLDFQAIPDTLQKIVDKYDKLEFEFADPDVEFDGDMASVLMRFKVYAETKPTQLKPAHKWEIVVDGRLDLQKEDDDWKITYWKLIPPFLKFEEEPL